MGIPRNARDKQLAWSLIKELSSVENTIRAAVNGNGPVRMSAYDDPRVRALVPYAEMERRVLPTAIAITTATPRISASTKPPRINISK